MKHLLALLAVATLSACNPKPTMPMVKEDPNLGLQPPGRVTVSRIGVFADDLAYSDRRGIYIITDTKTGQEFIGVSGVGIAETGSHQAGKSRVSDER